MRTMIDTTLLLFLHRLLKDAVMFCTFEKIQEVITDFWQQPLWYVCNIVRVNMYSVFHPHHHQINISCFTSDYVSTTDEVLQHGNRYLHAFKNNLIIINICFQVFTAGIFYIIVLWVLAPHSFCKWILILQSNRMPQYSRAEGFGPSLTLNW
jgi:hypothetical protein